MGALVAAGIICLIWIALAGTTSESILPGPGAVWSRFVLSLQDGEYMPAFLTTLQESVLGWLVAVVVGLPLGYFIGRFRSLEDSLAPYLAGSQAMPVVAIAPLLVLWLGFGLTQKVAVSALIAFFPILATTANGVRGVPVELVDAGRVFGAGPLQMLRQVYAPLSARTVFAGLKVAAALSVTGAVVGEFVASDQGLGALLLASQNRFDTPMVFAVLFSLMTMGALAYTSVSLVERVLLRWEE